MLKKQTIAAFLLFVTLVCGQSSDRVKYYILYDVSGSVAAIDTEKNLQYFLKQIIGRKENTIKSNISFEIIFVGEEKKNIKQSAYFLNQVYSGVKADEDLRLVKEINEEESSSAGQRYTYLKEALEKLMDKILEKQTSGIFILTDGRLDSNDIEDSNNYSKYIKDLNKLLDGFRYSLNVPVFLIQSSPLLSNPYFFDLNNGGYLKMDSDTLHYSKNVFWVNNLIKSRSKGNKWLDKFNLFLQDAHQQIITEKNVNLTKNDTIGLILQIGEILNNRENGNTIANNSEVEKLLNRIYKNFESDLSYQKIKKIQEDLKSILADKDIVQELAKTLKKQYSDKVTNFKNFKSISVKSISANLYMQQPYIDKPVEAIESAEENKSLEQTLILGLTDYLSDRIEQEVIFYFFEKYKEWVENLEDPNKGEKLDRFEDILFHNTMRLGDNILNHEKLQYDLTVLRETIKRDVDVLPESIMMLVDKQKFADEVIFLFYTYKFLNKFTETGSFFDALKSLHRLREGQSNLSNFERSLITSSRLINYLENNDLVTLFEDLNNSDKVEGYARLILISAFELNVRKDSSIENININEVVPKLHEFYKKYERVKKRLEQLNKKISDLSTENYDEYIKNYKMILYSLMAESFDMLSYSFTQFVKQYNSHKSVNEIDLVKRKIKKVSEVWMMMEENQYIKAFTTLMPILDTVLNNSMDKNTINNAIRLMRLGAEISEAKTQDDVKNILVRNTLPVASYRIKRKERAVMLNAYAAVAASCYESNYWNATVMLPIGLEYSFSVCSGRTLSFFGSIIDIGNIYFHKTNNLTKEDYKWEKIFAPGINVLYAPLSKTPLSIGVGYQWNSNRFNIFLGLDLPLYRIY